MADQKISELTALTGANVADDDAIAIVDTSATETKKIVFSELKNALDTATGFVRITGDTMTGDLNVLANVGIGTSSPSYAIDTLSSGAIVAQFKRNAAGGASGGIRFGNNDKQFTLYGDDSNGLSIYDGSTERMRITSAGNVGINTSSPAPDYGSDVALEIEGASSPGLVINDTGQASKYGIHADSNDLKITYGTGALATFQNDGNVGIGTSSPNRALTVEDGDIQIHDTGTSGDPLLNFSVGGTQASPTQSWSFRIDNSDSDKFQLMDVTDSRIVLTADGSGNVGIGTTSPDELLHIHGATQSYIKLTDDDSGEGATDGALFAFDGSSAAQYIWNYENGPTVFATNGSEAMRIDSSGNVGIGHVPSGNLTAGYVLRLDGGAQTYIAFNNDTHTTQVTGGFVIGSDSSAARITQRENQPLVFDTNNTERMRLDASGNVGIGLSSSLSGLNINGAVRSQNSASNISYMGFTSYTGTTAAGAMYSYVGGDGRNTGYLNFSTNDTERMRLDASGNLLVGKTAAGIANTGSEFSSTGRAFFTFDGGGPLQLNRKTSDGDIIELHKDGTEVGSIGFVSTGFYIQGETAHSGFRFGGNQIVPFRDGADTDDTTDLGASSVRFDDVYATNGTIQTSDQNEKQDIAELTDAEQRVAVAAKGLLRKFRWKDAVAEKGNEARTHFGIIAQDLQAAFAAEGLDAGDYAMFISSTWTDEDTGEERTRMGVRYSELLAFIIAAI